MKEDVDDFAESCGVEYQFIEGDVLGMDIEQTDNVIYLDDIDTWYNQLSKELRKHEKSVNKWIITT